MATSLHCLYYYPILTLTNCLRNICSLAIIDSELFLVSHLLSIPSYPSIDSMSHINPSQISVFCLCNPPINPDIDAMIYVSLPSQNIPVLTQNPLYLPLIPIYLFQTLNNQSCLTIHHNVQFGYQIPSKKSYYPHFLLIICNPTSPNYLKHHILTLAEQSTSNTPQILIETYSIYNNLIIIILGNQSNSNYSIPDLQPQVNNYNLNTHSNHLPFNQYQFISTINYPFKNSHSVPNIKPIVLQDGSIYQGNYKYQRNGPARQRNPDGTIFEGYFQDDYYVHGKLLQTNQDYYIGAFNKHNQKHGYGQEQNHDYIYTGNYNNGYKSGQGKQVYKDGAIYQGNYEDGSKTGQGTFQWPSNNHYVGQFKNDHMEGYGTYQWNDGKIYQGNWKKNQMHGHGRFIWPDGREFEGEYKYNKKHGFGIFKINGEILIEGTWVNGELE